MKKRNSLIRSGLLLGIMVVLASGVVIPFADAKDVPIPKMMTWTSYDVGSSGYMMVGHISTTLYDKYGTKIRILPAGTDIPRVYPVRLKDAEVAFHGLGSYFMQEGLGDYSSAEWGPQPVRALYFAQHPGLCLGIRGDSKIKSWKDLKGKKIATFPGSAPLTLISEVHLAYAGLTWKDVQPIKAPGYGAAIKMVMSGKIDATHINPTASKAYEMEAMPYGIGYIALPFKNKKNWEQLISHAPAYGPFLAEIGATLSPEKPLETVSYAYPIALVYDFLPEDKAYVITKMLVEAYPEYAKKHKSIEAYWSPKGSMALFEKYPLPMHKGAIRYYKEAGMWTSELEAKNQERLAHQAKLKELWDSAVDEALKKKMKMRKFGDFWKKKRAEAGL